MRFLILYILIICLVNLGFEHIPLVDLGFGFFSPMAAAVGFVFVIRDYAQRLVGHWVLLGMAFGGALSYYLANPAIAFASVTSFLISEIVDWIIFSVTKKPFHKRVLYSSLIATPIDTGVFLYIIDQVTLPTFVLMVLCKLIVAAGVWYYGKDKESSTSTA